MGKINQNLSNVTAMRCDEHHNGDGNSVNGRRHVVVLKKQIPFTKLAFYYYRNTFLYRVSQSQLAKLPKFF